MLIIFFSILSIHFRFFNCILFVIFSFFLLLEFLKKLKEMNGFLVNVKCGWYQSIKS